MLYTIDDIRGSLNTQAKINNKWVPARPFNGPFWWRIKAAWLVLIGKADAIVWPEGQ